MCHPVKCQVCGKTTWAGCGQHVAQVKASVPAGQWCDNRHTQADIDAAAAARASRGLLGRLFG